MTVQSEVSRSGPYDGAGTVGPFPVEFRFLADAHIRVIHTSTAGIDTTLELTTDYSVSGAGAATGSVTLVVALAVGEKLTIVRAAPFLQEADYVTGDSFPAESHEQALDLLTMQTQQIKEAQDRALALPATIDPGTSTELPAPVPNGLIGWNPAGDGLANIDPGTLAGVATYGSAVADTFDGDGVAVDFTLSADSFSVGNLRVSVGGVVQTPDVNFELVVPRTLRFLTGAPPVGTDNVLAQYGSSLLVGVADSVIGQTATGTALIEAADAAAARAAISAPSTSGVGASGTWPISISGAIPDGAVSTSAKIADNVITPEKLTQKITSGTVVASTSGTAIDFTGIPSWVKRISLELVGVSTSGSSVVQLQLGTSGGVVTTGYASCGSAIVTSSAAAISSTTGVPLGETSTNAAASTRNAVFDLTNISGNTWAITAQGNLGNTVCIQLGAGSITLGAVLDRIRLTTVNGTDTFDAGSVNIIYE